MTEPLRQQLIHNANRAFENVNPDHHLVAIEYDPATTDTVIITTTTPEHTRAVIQQAYVKLFTPKDAGKVLKA